jgi:prolyl oligopeptidase
VANTELDIRSEVDRYLIMPGQALAYKIGELKIKALRQKAEATLKERFDIKDFHQVVIENGAVPLAVLEHKVEQWLAAQA